MRRLGLIMCARSLTSVVLQFVSNKLNYHSFHLRTCHLSWAKILETLCSSQHKELEEVLLTPDTDVVYKYVRMHLQQCARVSSYRSGGQIISLAV